MTTVWFVDTSVFEHIINVPGQSKKKSPSREETVHDLQTKIKENRESQALGHEPTHLLLLPSATLIETGNHICQLGNGTQRREAAKRLEHHLRLTVAREAPWTLNEVEWNKRFLESFLRGASTGQSWVDHACQQTLGGGDLSILVERDAYRRRTGLRDVRVWTLDRRLKSLAAID